MGRAAMPEAAVDEHRHPLAREHHIGPNMDPRHLNQMVLAEPVAATLQQRAHPPLRAGIYPSVATHHRSGGRTGWMRIAGPGRAGGVGCRAIALDRRGTVSASPPIRRRGRFARPFGACETSRHGNDRGASRPRIRTNLPRHRRPTYGKLSWPQSLSPELSGQARQRDRGPPCDQRHQPWLDRKDLCRHKLITSL
jgi:hypothetical protein